MRWYSVVAAAAAGAVLPLAVFAQTEPAGTLSLQGAATEPPPTVREPPPSAPIRLPPPVVARPVAPKPAADEPAARGQNNVHGLGFAASASTGAGFSYRRYFGDTALSASAIAIIDERGDDAVALAGLGLTQYLLVWYQPHGRGVLPAVTALRLTGGAGWYYNSSIRQGAVAIDPNCTPSWDFATCPRADVKTVENFATLAGGIGFEFGGVVRTGFSLSLDLVLTAGFQVAGATGKNGLSFIYPLPQMALMYNW